VGSHVPQAPPAVPQVVVEAALHTFPAQQPVGHEVALQTQTPATHSDPVPHAGPVPQPHVPPVQLSATAELHVVQPPPPVPHAVGRATLHTLPAQQPVGHDVALHTHAPPTQACPAPHAAPVPHLHAPPLQVSEIAGSHARHAEPAAPHAVVLGVVQTEPAQQPVVHVTEQPEHVPETQV
jgi:hypothetical protein